MLIKLTDLPDGRIRAESPRREVGTFSRMSRQAVIEFLRTKAEEVGETVIIVENFDNVEEHVNFSRLMKRHF